MLQTSDVIRIKVFDIKTAAMDISMLSNYFTAIIEFTAGDPAALALVPVSYNILS